MTRAEAIRILDEVIPPPEHHTVDLDHLQIEQAWQCIKEELTAEPSKDSPDNVFVMRANMFDSDGIIKGLREEIADQIRSGVVILPPYMEPMAVEGTRFNWTETDRTLDIYDGDDLVAVFHLRDVIGIAQSIMLVEKVEEGDYRTWRLLNGVNG